MYAGHAAMGLALAAHAGDRRRRIAVFLVGASLVADIAWCVLTLASVEGGRSLGSQEFHAPRLPWSHSLLTTDLLALACAAVGAWIAAPAVRVRVALLAAAAVLLHWLAGDVPFGEAFPLTPRGEPIATPHIYAMWPLAFIVEAFLVMACGAMARRLLVSVTRARVAIFGLLALHVLAFLPSFANVPAVDLDAEPARITAYLVMLLAAWALTAFAVPREKMAA